MESFIEFLSTRQEETPIQETNRGENPIDTGKAAKYERWIRRLENRHGKKIDEITKAATEPN